MALKIDNKKTPYYLVAIASLMAFLMNYIPTIIVSASLLFIAFLLIKSHKTFLLFPIFIFYYSYLGQLFGMSVYRIYSFIFALDIILSNPKIFKEIKASAFAVLSVYLVYVVVAMIPQGVRLAIFSLWDILVVYFLVVTLRKNSVYIRDFFKVYAMTALLSFIFSKSGNLEVVGTVMGGEYFQIIRNNGTFEDSNYLGFFNTIAVFAMVSLKLFKKPIRILLITALYVTMFMTLSMTMLLVNILLWLLFLAITKKINIKTFLIIIIIILAGIGIYNWALTQPLDGNPIAQFAYKIRDKLEALTVGDINRFTTNRTKLSSEHMDFFLNQSPLEKLVGFNAVNTRVIDAEGLSTVAHNEYIDMLLNVGIMGTLILLGCLAANIYHILFAPHVKSDSWNEEKSCLLMCKATWIYYAATLTMFLDYRFFIFYLL